MNVESASRGVSFPECIVDGDILTNGMVSMVYGKSGTGKTTLALTVLVDTVVETGNDVLFIDTEGVSMQRFKQIIAERTPDGIAVMDVLEHVQMRQVTDYASQVAAVRAATRKAPEIELIVIDSLTARYRVKYGSVTDADDRRRVFEKLRGQVLALTGVARRYDIPVLMTNQVTTDPETDEIKPVGGKRLINWIDTVFRLSETGTRRWVDEVGADLSDMNNRSRVRITDQGMVCDDNVIS